MSGHARHRRALIVLLLALAAPASLDAQITTADIVGRVTDAAGGVLPGATVVVRNDATGLVRHLVTDARGEYVVNLLPIGTYAVEVSMPGFRLLARTLQVAHPADPRSAGLGTDGIVHHPARASAAAVDAPRSVRVIAASDDDDPLAGRSPASSMAAVA